MKYKKLLDSIITFDHGDDLECLILAKLGMSNKAIKARGSLTDNQISYRLVKAKQVEKNDLGYRVSFRNGVSPFATQMIRDLHSVVQADIRERITAQIIKPTPETVKVAELRGKIGKRQH